MPDLITDHPYEHGPFGRCAYEGCNKRKAAHVDTSRVAIVEPPPGPPPAPPPPPPARVSPLRPVETTLLEADLSVSTIPVTIRKRRAAQYEADWPGTWSLPTAGNAVRVSEQVLTVRQIEFDLDSERIIIHCD